MTSAEIYYGFVVPAVVTIVCMLGAWWQIRH